MKFVELRSDLGKTLVNVENITFIYYDETMEEYLVFLTNQEDEVFSISHTEYERLRRELQ